MTPSFYEFMTTVQPYSHGTALRCNRVINQIIPTIPLDEILTGDISTFPQRVLGKNVTSGTMCSTWRPAVMRFREYHEYLGTETK